MHRQTGYYTAGIGLLLALLVACVAIIFSNEASAKSLSSAPALVSVGSPVSTDTPSSIPTDTTSTATSTRTRLPTSTPTLSPTPCTLIDFSDVPPESTFYTYIRCLACHGFVSGYDDGTFRPNNQVTRGQLSKIVANTAGYSLPIPADRQTYEDVPSGSTFWLYVERLTAGYVIEGYPCGGVPEEVCVPPQNRAYFRVNGPATRGQVAKVVCLVVSCQGAFGIQTFEDVPVSHPFYRYVQYLGERGLVSGYPCGGPGELCIPPNNRPYFRPYSNATRGQVTKIMVNAFILPCQFSAVQH